MPDGGEIITENFESSIENLNIEHWEDVQMTNTLRLLNGEDQTSFYRIEGEKVVYDIETVKKYLTHICKKEDGTLKTWKEMTDDIQSENIKAGNKGGATSAWTTAVQIGLEYLGYDIGKIDGNLGDSTKYALKKYQRYSNLGIDGQPGAMTVDNLVKGINKIEKNKGKLEGVKEKILENEKKYNFEGCINVLNGCVIFTDKFIKKLKTWYKTCYEYDNFDGDTASYIFTSIEKLLEGVLKPGENWSIEYKRGNEIVKEVFSYNNRKHNIMDLLAEIYLLNNIKDIKLVPDFMMGYDSYFLGGGRPLNNIRELGITMEECKPFVDKYLEIKNKDDIEEIDIRKFFYDELGHEMLKFLFGVDAEKWENLYNIDIKTGLKFYKIKSMRGEIDFMEGISSLLDAGMFNHKFEINKIIDSIIKSKLKYDNLSKHIELYKYLDKKGLQIDYDALSKYGINKYLKVLKQLDKHKIQYENYFDNNMCDYIESYDFCINNKISLTVFNYFGGNLGYYAPQLLIDLFKDKSGRELYSFLSKYPQQLSNLGGKEIDEIELNTEEGGYNFCFRGIVEMIKSRDDIIIPILPEDATEAEEQEWKASWEKIIKEYENILRNYISMDKDENGERKEKNETFDKIFFSNATEHHVEDNGVCQGKNNIHDILETFTNNFEDCSNIIDKNGKINQTNQKILIENIRKYHEQHPNEKILVYFGYHGDEDGSSSNGWNKQDRINLSNISPNIRIMSPRCYFGRAYSDNQEKGDNIYSIQSVVSGYSNNTCTHSDIINRIREGYEKGLGFHEMEIYARLNYDYSFTPLIDFADYIDFNTGEERRGKIGIADAGNGEQSEDDEYYG